jgi:uncharacterized repeat protein (TIGR01451 family)
MRTRNFISRLAAAALFLVIACFGYADASITVNKQFAPTSVGLGVDSVVTVTLQNSDTGAPVTLTTFKDDVATMSGGGVIDASVAPTTDCTPGGPAALSIVGTAIVMNGGTIPMASNGTTPGACHIVFSVSGNKTGNHVNTILAADVTSSGGSPPGDVSQTLSIASANINVSAGGSQIAPFGNTTTSLTYTISNPTSGPGVPLTNASFSIDASSTVPFSVVGLGTTTTTTCPGAVFGALPTSTLSGPVSITGATIPVGGCTVTLNVESSSAGPANAVVSFTLPASPTAGSFVTDQGITNSGQASNTATFETGSPNVSKSFGNGFVQPGTNVNLSIGIQNLFSSQDLRTAAITDTFPAGLTLFSTPTGSASCGPAVFGTTGSGTLTMTGGQITANSTCTISAVVAVSAGQGTGTVTNSIPAGSFTTTDIVGATGSGASSNTFVTAAGGAYTIAMSGPGTALPFTPFQYTVTMTSQALGAFNGGGFTNLLPQTQVSTAVVNDATHLPTLSAGCGAGTITAVAGSTTVTGSNLSIPAGGVCQVTYWAEFTAAPTSTTLSDNNIIGNGTNPISFNTNPGGVAMTPQNGQANASVTEVPSLTIQNYSTSGSTLLNQPVTVQAQISDPNGVTDTNFVAQFPLDLSPNTVQLAPTPNFVFGPGCPSGLTQAGNIVIPMGGQSFQLTIPSISATCVISYDVIDIASAAGSLFPKNPSYVSTLTGGASFAFPHQGAANFQTSNIDIAKSFTPNQIQAGGTAVASITLSVEGVAGFTKTQANGVTFQDSLPTNVFFAAAPNPTFSAGCQQTGQPLPSAVIAGTIITFNNISLLTNNTTPVTCTVGFTVSSTTIGTPLNFIAAGAVHSTSGITNSQSVSASLTVSSGIAVSKTFVSSTMQIGSTDYIRFLLTNSAATSTLSGGTLVDNMPAGQMVVASTTPGSLQPGDGALSLCGGTITSPVGSSNLNVTNLTVGPVVGAVPGQCVLYVLTKAATTAAPGLVTNTIGAAGVSFNAGALQNQNGSSAGDTYTAAPPVSINKAFSLTTITPGTTSVLTINIVNNAVGAAPLSGMALSDALPPNIFVAPVPAASTTCAGGTVTAVAGTGTVSLANGTILPGASCSIIVTVTGAVPGIFVNTISAGALTSLQGASNTAPAQATLNIGNTSGVGISKSFLQTVIAPGATSLLTITIVNNATTAVPLTNMGVVDTLPANVKIAATPNAATTCTSGTATATAGGSTIALSGASILVNGSCTITVNVTGTLPGTYTNTIPAGPPVGPPGTGITDTQGATNGAAATANITIGQPSLAVTKTSLPSGATVSPGQSIAYTVNVTNNGTQPETNTHITDALAMATLTPGSVTINGVAVPDAVILSSQPFGTLAIGGTDIITYSATVNANAPIGASVTNTATIGGDQPCSSGTCSGTSPTNTVAPPVLTVGKQIDGTQSESVVSGQTITYDVSIANTGTGPAVNASMSDTVPSGLTVVPNSVTVNNVASTTATLVSQTLAVPLGTVVAGTTTIVKFKATVGPTAGNSANTVSVTAAGLTKAVISNAALAHQVPAAIAVTKTTTSTTVSTGDRVNYTITATPVGGIGYGLTTIVDTLPDYEVYGPGTSRVNGKAQEPSVTGHVLTWTVPNLTGPVTITYSVAIAPGTEANTTLTNLVNVTALAPGGAGFGRGAASASVLVVGSTFGSCYPITGRVYLDVNGSGHFQDPDVGLHSVKIFLDNGESVVTDSTGRYDYPCVHPGMHALRLDATTLPSGVIPYDDRNIDSEKSTRRLVHHIYDTTIIEDINFAVTGTPDQPIQPGGSGSKPK